MNPLIRLRDFAIHSRRIAAPLLRAASLLRAISIKPGEKSNEYASIALVRERSMKRL
jgi:hypothetical protein